MQEREKFVSLMKDFGQGMLVTHQGEQFHARPMNIAEVDSGGNLWLISGAHSAKVSELQESSQVTITMQKSLCFAAVRGSCKVSKDVERVHQLWREAWRLWFPDGPKDPNIVLLHVTTHDGEYWDNSGMNAAKYFFRAVKAYIAGESPEVDTQRQAKVNLQ